MSSRTVHISIHEFCQREGVSEQHVHSIVEHGIAQPLVGQLSRDWAFDNNNVRWMQKALRLRHDLDIDWIATAMVIDLLRQRESLHRDNRQLRQRLRRFVAQDD